MAVARPEVTLEKVVSEERTPYFPRLSPHPALRDFGLTAATSVFVAMASLIVISLVGKKLGPALLGEYLLIRRVASWVQVGVQVPSGVALPRYVASDISQSRSTKQTYFLAAFLMGCGIALLLAAFLIMWKDSLSRSIFGSAQMSYLMSPLAVLLLGLAANGAVFGYYQGNLAMARANIFTFGNLVLVPILATVLLWRAHSIPLIVNAIGLSMVFGAILFALPILRHLDFGAATEQFGKRASELFSYGVARIPADFGMQALLSLPAVIAAHFLPIASVAFLLLGGTFLAVVSTATLPLGIILLSRLSKSLAQNRSSELRVRVSYLVSALIDLPVFACFQMIVFCDVIVRTWVGPSFLEGIRVIQIVILAVPFFFFFTGLCRVIDAASVKAYNARNILISLGVFLLTAAIVNATVSANHLLEGLAASSVIALAVLASFTFRTLRHLYEIEFKWTWILPGLGLAFILGVLSFTLRSWAHFRPGIVGLAVFELLISGVFLVFLKQLGSAWIPFLLDSMFLPTSQNRGAVE